MIVNLVPHPTTPDGPIASVTVHLERNDGRLWVRFVTEGKMNGVAWPGPSDGGRTDELWRHTCFEVFVMTHRGYREFNLSSSGQWASYRFDGYREGMADAAEAANVSPLDLADDMLAMEADIDLPSPVGRIALSALIEGLDGGMTYWALAHPSDKPDFHHPDSFVLDLP